MKTVKPPCRSADSGFTLIELVVTVAVAAIVMGSVVIIFMLAYRSYYGSQRQTSAQTLAVLTLEKVSDTVHAESVTICPDKEAAEKSGDPAVYFDAASGGISIGGGTYLNGAFKNRRCVFTFTDEGSSDRLLGIEVKVTDLSGNIQYSIKGRVFLENGKVSGGTGGAALTYTQPIQ